LGGTLSLPRTYLGPQGSATDSILLSDQCFTPDTADGTPPPEDPQDAKFNNLVTASAIGRGEPEGSERERLRRLLPVPAT
jgi:hypothetical protein